MIHKIAVMLAFLACMTGVCVASTTTYRLEPFSKTPFASKEAFADALLSGTVPSQLFLRLYNENAGQLLGQQESVQALAAFLKGPDVLVEPCMGTYSSYGTVPGTNKAGWYTRPCRPGEMLLVSKSVVICSLNCGNPHKERQHHQEPVAKQAEAQAPPPAPQAPAAATATVASHRFTFQMSAAYKDSQGNYTPIGVEDVSVPTSGH